MVECVKIVFDWYEVWFCIFEFVGCLFECVLVEFGIVYVLILDVVICYCCKMVEWMVELIEVVVLVEIVNWLVIVFMMLLDGVMVEVWVFNDFVVV